MKNNKFRGQELFLHADHILIGGSGWRTYAVYHAPVGRPYHPSPQYLITVIDPGTSPKDMEEQVVKPLKIKFMGSKTSTRSLLQ